MRVSYLVREKTIELLDNSRYVTLCAVMLCLLPYASGLSMALIALVTLRKGARDGLLVLMPVALVHAGFLLQSMSVEWVCINTVLTYIPVYIASCVLGSSVRWNAAYCAFIAQASCLMLLLHVFMPGYIIAQYAGVRSLVGQQESLSGFFNDPMFKDSDGINQAIFSNYVLGSQALSIVCYALLALLLARFVQSRLFYPGGFKQEMLTFCGNKLAILFGGVVVIAAMKHQVMAINMLPIVVFYFLLVGLSLSAHALSSVKRTSSMFILLLLPLGFFPLVLGPVYIMLGSLDSLFNLRTRFKRVPQ